MPNNTTVSSALLIKRGDTFDQGFNTKHLLITSNDFACFFIEQGKELGHFQKAVMSK